MCNKLKIVLYVLGIILVFIVLPGIVGALEVASSLM